MAHYESLVKYMEGILWCHMLWILDGKLVSNFSVIELLLIGWFYFFILSKIGWTCSNEGRFPGSSFIQIRMNFAICWDIPGEISSLNPSVAIWNIKNMIWKILHDSNDIVLIFNRDCQISKYIYIPSFQLPSGKDGQMALLLQTTPTIIRRSSTCQQP